MSTRKNYFYGGVDAPKDGKVFGMLHNHGSIVFTEIPVKLFSKRDQARLKQNTNVEVCHVGRRIKARIVQ